MSRYIDADLIPWTDIAEGTPMKKPIKVLITFADKVNRMPTADVRENVKGEWIYDGKSFKNGYNWMHCSACGGKEVDCPAGRTNFCPNCGADMRGNNND